MIKVAVVLLLAVLVAGCIQPAQVVPSVVCRYSCQATGASGHYDTYNLPSPESCPSGWNKGECKFYPSGKGGESIGIDTDGDLTPDKHDQCPNTYGEIMLFGCPKGELLYIIDATGDEVRFTCPADTWCYAILPESPKSSTKIEYCSKGGTCGMANPYRPSAWYVYRPYTISATITTTTTIVSPTTTVPATTTTTQPATTTTTVTTTTTPQDGSFRIPVISDFVDALINAIRNAGRIFTL